MKKDNINKKISGIYKITNLINNKFYIGSAVSLLSRYHTHKNSFVKNKHKNQHLQNSINKYGIDNFKFEVIELCNKKELLIKEQYYIDTLNPDYNICLIAGNSLGVKRSEEYKENQRKIQTGLKHIPHSEETKRKISESNKGRKNPKESIERQRQKLLGRKHENTKPWIESKQKQFKEKGSKKLQYSQVQEIKELFNSKLPLKEIATKFNVSISTIKAIKYKINWNH
jgi:group I intron endonuclease